MARTKSIFLNDAQQRGALVLETAGKWREGLLSADELGAAAHAYAHALRGVALTVGCGRVHEISEHTINHSIQHSEEGWNQEAAEALVQLLRELAEEVKREAQAAEEGGSGH